MQWLSLSKWFCFVALARKEALERDTKTGQWCACRQLPASKDRMTLTDFRASIWKKVYYARDIILGQSLQTQNYWRHFRLFQLLKKIGHLDCQWQKWTGWECEQNGMEPTAFPWSVFHKSIKGDIEKDIPLLEDADNEGREELCQLPSVVAYTVVAIVEAPLPIPPPMFLKCYEVELNRQNSRLLNDHFEYSSYFCWLKILKQTLRNFQSRIGAIIKL